MFVQLDPVLIISGLTLGAWIAAKLFLKDLSDERKRNLKAQFKNLSYHFAFGATLFLIYSGLSRLTFSSPLLERMKVYSGLATILSGATVFLKVWRILVFEYLFLSHMKVAFPVLLVNLFTLLVAIVLGSWIGAELFNISLAPLLATSAIFSLVLGLALQDTLGNLFAGVALQFDKPYGIGDWIEIQNSGQKWTGQVKEISWRATVLTSFTEELITIPNRIMAQAQIANFSTENHPVIRTQIFRVPFGSDILDIKKRLTHSASLVAGVRKLPTPLTLISDTTESWMSFKVVYWIDHYGDQFLIADRVYSQCLADLEATGIKLASHRIALIQDETVLTS